MPDFPETDVISTRGGHAVGHNRETRDESAEPKPSSTSPDANPKQGGSAVGRLPSSAWGVDRSIAVSAVTVVGGAGTDGE